MELTLPVLGDVMTEGTLAAWLQPSGTFVAAGAPLYQLETDKVSLTVEAPASGVLEQVVAAGETVPVGTVVGRLRTPAQPEVPAQPAAPPPLEVPTPPKVPTQPGVPAPPEVRASPAARRLAARLGVDLAQLGSARRIREADVHAYVATQHAGAQAPAQPAATAPPQPTAAAAPAPAASGVPTPAPTPRGVPLAGRRKLIAERMRSSLQQTAQLTIATEIDMTEALRVRAQLQQLLPDAQQPTITDLVIRATVLALQEHPALNATLQDGVLLQHAHIHMGLAVDAEEGLIVPIIRNAQALPLKALAEQTRLLVARARDNRLTLEDVHGATFTITSLGPQGVDFFTPIINPPQVAILGIGRIVSRLVLDHERPVERACLYLNLSFDHQVIDGAPAARFLQSTKRLLELPASLLV